MRLTAPDGSTRDTTIAFPVGSERLQIELSVPLRTAGQSFRADVELKNDLGQVLFSSYQQYLRADQRACVAAIENLWSKYAVTAKQIEAARDEAAEELQRFLVELGYE